MSKLNCLLCNSNASSHLWFVKKVGTADYPIFRCDSCKSAYVWPRPDLRALQRLYSDQPTADSDFSPSHKSQYRPTGEKDASRLFNSFGGLLKGLDVLDIGAGDGAAAAEATQRGLSVRALDPSPVSRKNFAERLGFQPDAAFFDGDYAKNFQGHFDVAIVSHLLEHISDPDQFIEDVSTVLRPSGRLIISLPLFGSVLTAVMGKKDFFLTPPIHLTYFSSKGLGQLLERHGYLIESSYTSSKVNMTRYKRSLGPLSYAVNYAAYLFLRSSELVNRSVVLNVCARRV